MLDMAEEGLYKFGDKDVRKVSQLSMIEEEGLIVLLAGELGEGRGRVGEGCVGERKTMREKIRQSDAHDTLQWWTCLLHKQCGIILQREERGNMFTYVHEPL